MEIEAAQAKRLLMINTAEHGEKEREKQSLRKSNSVTENGPLNDFMDRTETDDVSL